MRLFFRCGKKFCEAQKQDQSWILAQNFLSCGNLSAGFARRVSIQNSRASLCQVPRKLMPHARCNFVAQLRKERENNRVAGMCVAVVMCPGGVNCPPEPRSGARIKPSAQAVGIIATVGKNPEGAKEDTALAECPLRSLYQSPRNCRWASSPNSSPISWHHETPV